MDIFATPLILTAVLSLLLGLMLSVLSKYLAVPDDTKSEEILAVLPGINCGACGYPGCSGYAKAVSEGEAPVDACRPGKKQLAERIQALLDAGQ